LLLRTVDIVLDNRQPTQPFVSMGGE
jgi:hypothetical protein